MSGYRRVLKIGQRGAARWLSGVKVFAAKPDSLSWILGIYIVEEESRLPSCPVTTRIAICDCHSNPASKQMNKM